MTADPLDEKGEDTSNFEKLVNEIHEYLEGRSFIVSRMKLRRALIVFAAQEGLSPASGAKVMQVMLIAHVTTPAQLIDLA